MNRGDIERLQAIRGYPAVSLLAPMHRTSPDNRQDPIRIKNLVTEATNRLQAEFSQREVQPLLTRLQARAQEIDYVRALDGLAIFVNPDYSGVFPLPFQPPERVVIGESFATRDLVFALNRSPRYWVLLLSEQPTRLFEGARDTLVEGITDEFPLAHTGPGGSEPLPGGHGISRSAARDEAHRHFFRRVDAALGQIMAADPLPMIVIGVDRHLSFFREVSSHTQRIVATITGNHDKTPPHELARMAWPLIQEHLAGERQRRLEELNAAVSARRASSGLGEVWRMAHEGRGSLLLVEENYHAPARIDATGLHLTPADDPGNPTTLDDAVDDVIETVLARGGQIVFVDDGLLATHQRIALILRF